MLFLWRRHGSLASWQRWIEARNSLDPIASHSAAARHLSHHMTIHCRNPIQNSTARSSVVSRYNRASAITSSPSLPSAQRFSTKRQIKYEYWDVKECKTIDDLLSKTLQKFDNSSPTTVAAAWNYISTLLGSTATSGHDGRKGGRTKKRVAVTRRKDEVSQRETQIKSLLDKTADNLFYCRPRDLTTIILALGKIVRIVRPHGTGQPAPIQQAFRNVLVDKNSTFIKEKAFRPFSEAANTVLSDLDPRHLSNLSYAYALLEHVPTFKDGSNIFGNIASVAIKRINQFNPQDISNMVWAYTTIKISQSTLFKKVADPVTVDVSHPLLFQKIGDTILTNGRLEKFKHQELSNTVWAYAAGEIHHPRLFEAVADTIVRQENLGGFKPQAFANIAWSYVTMNISHPLLFAKIADAVVDSDLNGFKPLDLSNIVWSLVVMKEHNPKLMKKIGDAVAAYEEFTEFNGEAFANIVWAFTTAGVPHPKMYERVGLLIAMMTMEGLHDFYPRDVSRLLWSYATANVFHGPLFSQIGFLLYDVDHFCEFKANDFSTILWSYSTMKLKNPPVFKVIGEAIFGAVGELMPFFAPRDISDIVWAFTNTEVTHPPMFKRIGDEVAGLNDDDLKKFTPRDTSTMLWAYAAANIAHKSLFLRVGDVLADQDYLDSFESHDFFKLIWAYAVVDVDLPSVFDENFVRTRLGSFYEMSSEEMSMLFQWHLWRTEEQSSTGLPRILQQQCYDAFISVDKNAREANHHEEVIEELKFIGMDPQENFLTPSGYRLDVLVEVGGNKKVGIEMHDYSDFLDYGQNPKGSIILKQRQIGAIDNIPVASVTEWDWDMMCRDRTLKHEYLQNMLKKVI